MALGPGLPTRMVCPSPFWRTASAVPMVPPPPDRFSTIADWPHAVCRCAASNRPITSVVPPAAAGTMRRTFSVGRQSAAWPRRGKAAVAESAAAADSTRRRESSLVTFHSLLGFSFAGERRKCAGGRQADGLAQAPGLEHDPEKHTLGPRPDGWVPVFPRDKHEAFPRRSCSNKKIERDDDSKKSHPALAQLESGHMDYMCQVSSSELGLIDPCLDLCVDFVECALERGIDGAEVWKRSGEAWAQEAVETGLTRARHEPASGATKSTRLVGLRRSLASTDYVRFVSRLLPMLRGARVARSSSDNGEAVTRA